MWLREPAQQSSDLEQLQPMQNQNAMLDACEAGDVSKLQRLLKNAGVKQGDAAFEPFFGEPVPATGPPPTSLMLTAAIAHQQASVVACLLAIYRNVDLERDSILLPILDNPHLPTLETLHSHTPSIVNYEFRESRTTLLTEACRTSDPCLPLWLLRLGADPNHCGPGGAGPLLTAVECSQSLEIIRKMTEYGAIVKGNVIGAAINAQAPALLKFLLDRARLDHPKEMLEQAQATEDKEMAALVWQRIKQGEKSPLKRRKIKGKSTFQYDDRVDTKWWQIGRLPNPRS